MTEKANTERLLTVDQLAEALNVSRKTVYRLIDSGLPHYRVGAHVRFRLPEVLDALHVPEVPDPSSARWRGGPTEHLGKVGEPQES